MLLDEFDPKNDGQGNDEGWDAGDPPLTPVERSAEDLENYIRKESQE